jgi:hypothetical protein
MKTVLLNNFLATWATLPSPDQMLVMGDYDITEAVVFAARAAKVSGHRIVGQVLDDTTLRSAFEQHLVQTLLNCQASTVVCAVAPWLSAKNESVQRGLGELATSPTQPFAFSFAEFLVCRLEPQRLALVLPNSFLTSPMLQPLRELLTTTYTSLSVILCDELLEEKKQIVVLGSQGAARQRGVYALRFTELELFSRLEPNATLGRRVSEQRFIEGKNQMMLLSEAQEETLRALRVDPAVVPLGTLVKVRQGYSLSPREREFFELTASQAKALNLPERYLKKAVFGTRGVKDKVLTQKDFDKAAQRGDAGYLLVVDDGAKDKQLESYLETGKVQGMADTHGAKQRQPWYCLEPRDPATLLLETEVTKAPKLSLNEAGVLASDDLLELFCSTETAKKLVQVWYSPLTEVTCELAGLYNDGRLELSPSLVADILVVREHIKALPLDSRDVLRDMLKTLRRGRSTLLAP